MLDLKNASVLVSGGASGLGAATARQLAARGATVVVVDRDGEQGAKLTEELGRGAIFVKADVTSETEVQNAIDRAVALAPVRVAVNCAGVGWAQRTVNKDGVAHDLSAFEKVLQVNLLGTFNVLRLAAAAMMQNQPGAEGERGVIVNTASVAAFDGQIGQIAYAASKAGVAGLTLPAARDLSKIGVRVCTIAPGTFDTPMLATLPEPQRQALAATIPFPNRLGRPEDYAALALHIVDNAYLNGETIRLDGALRMAPK